MAVSVVAVVAATATVALDRVVSTVARVASTRMDRDRRLLARTHHRQRRVPTHSTAPRVVPVGAFNVAGRHDPGSTHLGAGYIVC